MKKMIDLDIHIFKAMDMQINIINVQIDRWKDLKTSIEEEKTSE